MYCVVLNFRTLVIFILFIHMMFASLSPRRRPFLRERTNKLLFQPSHFICAPIRSSRCCVGRNESNYRRKVANSPTRRKLWQLFSQIIEPKNIFSNVISTPSRCGLKTKVSGLARWNRISIKFYLQPQCSTHSHWILNFSHRRKF